MSVINLLNTKRSSDDLQTDLFDLLGFERLELIQELLQHREEFVTSYENEKQSFKQELAAMAAGIKIINSRCVHNLTFRLILYFSFCNKRPECTARATSLWMSSDCAV